MKKIIQANSFRLLLCLSLIILFCSFNHLHTQRIVSANGTATEIICALGHNDRLVGVDVTSTYPEEVKSIASIGHPRSFSAEGILSLRPTLLLGYESDLSESMKKQLGSLELRLYKRPTNVEETKTLIRSIAGDLDRKAQGEVLVQQLEKDLKYLKKPSVPLRILFLYARGAGTLLASGTGTAVHDMIELAGCTNAIQNYADFKPLNTEALVAANPDVILLFDSGLESLGGINGVLAIQGIPLTKAGKNKKIISMDGQLLTGFGPRLGKALRELVVKASQGNLSEK
ncbi:MAG: ABC transporter substrate-binding protein [Cytophagaceae bacterium]|jgi:iron complex transport system substrate-binding protein|nr:ABC transporter substrate-binding protein [Cytophagaceae bacterium]